MKPVCLSSRQILTLHLEVSEELKDASRTLPRTMIWSTVLNGLMGWIMIITFCFALGNLDEVLASATGYPYIQVCIFVFDPSTPGHRIRHWPRRSQRRFALEE